ncbi:MAG: protein kinase [Deltaproteobacteria bacterium]|nr:protein kinase [Deltaproteobacteria bacterium]
MQTGLRSQRRFVRQCGVVLGTRINNWILRKELGGGSYGTVYLATNENGAAPVAIKVLHQSVGKPEIVQRFLAEARAAGKIKHPAVTRIIDAATHPNGFHYLVMELLEGESLHQRILGGPIAPWHVAELCRQAAVVLAAAHKEGIVHRDLKPENLFLVPDDDLRGKLRIKVLDFGVAKLTGTLALDKTLGMAGSPPYMSPEQWLAAPTIDGRADIYALGCVAFEMLTGAPPFKATNLPEFVTAHLHGPVPTVRSRRADVPEAFDALITRMLAKRPEDRPASMSEIAKACEQLTSVPQTLVASPMSQHTMSGYSANAPQQQRADAPNDPRLAVTAPSGEHEVAKPSMPPSPATAFDAFPSGRAEPPSSSVPLPRAVAVGSTGSEPAPLDVRPRFGFKSTGWMVAVSALALGMLVVIVYVVVDYVRRPDTVRVDKDDGRFNGLRDIIGKSNPWRALPELPTGPELTSYQVTLEQYAQYMQAIQDTPTGLAGQPNIDMMVPAAELPSAHTPIGDVTIEQARGFCHAIGGTLPSESTWRTAAEGRGDIENADHSLGPSREWVNAAVPTQCGNDRNDNPRDRSLYEKTVCRPAQPASRLGFRCAKN